MSIHLFKILDDLLLILVIYLVQYIIYKKVLKEELSHILRVFKYSIFSIHAISFFIFSCSLFSNQVRIDFFYYLISSIVFFFLFVIIFRKKLSTS